MPRDRTAIAAYFLLPKSTCGGVEIWDSFCTVKLAQNAPDEPMPLAGHVAMWLGIFFSLVVGCGLMALMFYSSRRGYDDRTNDKTGLG